MIAMIPIDDIADQSDPWSENQQIMFDYVTGQVLPILRSNGIWFAPAERAPLTFPEVMVVFKAIVEHANYDQQKLNSPDDLGNRVAYDPATRMVSVVAPNMGESS